MRHVLLSLLCVLGLVGCGDPLDPGSYIADPRVLGGIVSVEGDATRASPAPGETATVTFLVATPPGDTSTFGWAFVPCVQSSASLSVPTCQGGPLAADITMGEGDAPTARFTVPTADALGGAKKMLVVGIVCANGTPTLAGGSPGCSASTTKTQVVTLSVDLQLGAPTTNQNPDVSGVDLTFGGRSWTEAPIGTDARGCLALAGGPELPLVTQGDEVELTIDLSSVEREEFERTISGDPPLVEQVRETLQLSQFSTVNGMARQFSVVDDASTTSVADVTWTADADDFDASGTRVDFVFVLRDERGGVATFRRSACAVPAE